MTYDTMEEVFDAKARALTALEARTGELVEVQGHFHPAEGRWSVSEVLEHLLLVETQLLRMISALLKKAEASGVRPTKESFTVDVDALLERSSREKYVTREGYQPSGTMSISTAVDGLKGIQEDLQKLRPRLLAADPTQSRFPHWIFGPLDLAQWLAFLTLHEERHLRQIESLMEEADFPRGG
jgi:hypothetical protein